MKSLAFAVVVFGVAQLQGAVAAASAPSTEGGAALFEVEDVRLRPGPFQQAQALDRDSLLALDPDRLLLMFHVTAGISARWTKPLGGWEAPGVELRGHTLGHYLSACALMFAATGDVELKRRVDTVVSELAKCQQEMPAQGYHAGYLAAFPESFFGRVEAGKTVWSPWYTLHKLLAGLLDAHVHAGNAQALDVATRLAAWVQWRSDRLTPEQMQAMLKTESGGMSEALANLAALTKNPDHLRLAVAFNHRAVLDPLARGEDALDGLHANTQIPKVIGVARQYELTGRAQDRELAEFFWQRVARHRSYATGGNSDDEHFFPPAEFAQHLSPVAEETCNTYNMLKLTRHLFAWKPSAELMDYYERALYNHILASQDPKTGRVTYFLGLKPGQFKVYATPEESFWCCVGTGMENHATYGNAIYAQAKDAVWVNLFIASELTWRERGVVLRQETRFPDEPMSRLRLQTRQPVTFDLRVRQPAWMGSPLAITVNGEPAQTTTREDGYVSLRREWRDGDTVEIALPMTLRTEALPGSAGMRAIFYGPILLAGDLGADGMPRAGAYAREQKEFMKWPTPPVPALAGDPVDIVKALEPVAGESMTFRTHGIGQPEEVTLRPFFRLHHTRYTVYWRTGVRR